MFAKPRLSLLKENELELVFNEPSSAVCPDGPEHESQLVTRF